MSTSEWFRWRGWAARRYGRNAIITGPFDPAVDWRSLNREAAERTGPMHDEDGVLLASPAPGEAERLREAASRFLDAWDAPVFYVNDGGAKVDAAIDVLRAALRPAPPEGTP